MLKLEQGVLVLKNQVCQTSVSLTVTPETNCDI